MRFAPPWHNPFVLLDLNHKPALASHFKMTRLERHTGASFSALDATGVLYTPPEVSPRGEACGRYDALTLGMWERQVARPAATEIFGSPIARIETYGSFSCRNIAGTGRRSEHATANAVDISGLRLEDGRLINVKTRWNNGGKEGEFLKRVRTGACRIFSVTLGPDYNAAHADHFDFDMGNARTYR